MPPPSGSLHLALSSPTLGSYPSRAISDVVQQFLSLLPGLCPLEGRTPTQHRPRHSRTGQAGPGNVLDDSAQRQCCVEAAGEMVLCWYSLEGTRHQVLNHMLLVQQSASTPSLAQAPGARGRSPS